MKPGDTLRGVSLLEPLPGARPPKWRVRCGCGVRFLATTSQLINGATRPLRCSKTCAGTPAARGAP